jgi:signal transduction histidine kinase
MLNLVLNARDAMPDGGPIEVRLAAVRLTSHPSYTGRFVMLGVSDRGAGMDEATRRRVFEPFFTTKPQGTGLGLPIVRRVADRAGGLVRVESTPGEGTTFRVFLPRIGAGTGGTVDFAIPPELRPEDPGRGGT